MKKKHILLRLAPVLLALATIPACEGVRVGQPSTQISTPGVLRLSPPSMSFGNVPTGTSQRQSVTATNVSGSALTITEAAISNSAGFDTSGLVLPLILTPGQSKTFEVIFRPQSMGSVSGKLVFTNDGSISSVGVGLSATGVIPRTLVTSPTSFSFGEVWVGTSQSQTETLTNSGSKSLTVSAAAVSGEDFRITGLRLPLTLSPNQSFTFAVEFAPKSRGSRNGGLSMTVSDGNSADAALSGMGVIPAVLIASPTSLTFGSLPVGTVQTHTETVQNTGHSNATISQAWEAGTGFKVAGPTMPLTLAPGESASFSVSFEPKFKGRFTGSLSLTSNAPSPFLTVSLSGSATGTLGELSVNPGVFDVGDVAVGSSRTRMGTLSATGASVTVSNANWNSSEFAISGLKLPVTIAAGQQVKFAVRYKPESRGGSSASASFTSNASNSPTGATLMGTGVAAPVRSVSLSWMASPAPDITSYNVYRSVYGSSCDVYSQIGSTSGFTTTYTDVEATDAVTYCYLVTAVNSANDESMYSSAVRVAIPAP